MDAAITAFVMLHLTTWDADTGKLLYESERPIWGYSIYQNKIEDCRTTGLKRAYERTYYFRERGYPNAFTNIDCEWHRRVGDPA